MKTKIDAIIGDEKMNDMMHKMDMFEDGKVLGERYTIEIIHTEQISKKMLRGLKEGIEATGDNVVSFLGVKGKKSVYFRENTQSISTGKSWATFPDILKSMGYKCETDERMVVTSITSN